MEQGNMIRNIYLSEIENLNVFKSKNVYIYNFNEYSKHLMWWLAENGIKIKGFIVESTDRLFGKWLNKCIISTNTEEYCDLEGLVINVSKTCSILEFKKNYTLDILFEPFAMFYLIEHVMDKGKKVILFGSKQKSEYMRSYLQLFDIECEYTVDINENTSNLQIELENRVWERNAFELIYENIEEICVIVLPGAKKKAELFVECSGINRDVFMCPYHDKYLGPMRLGHYECLDPNLGYCSIVDDCSNIVSKTTTKANERKLKIAVLGGSTSDVTLYTEKSWIEWLIEIAEENNTCIEIICAAVDGYNAAQELVRLERDIIPENPDIVISYSRINQYGSLNHSNPRLFIHKYQDEIFNEFNRALSRENGEYMKNAINYGSNSSQSGRWINMERMMKGICQEFGIEFHAILQPFFWEKKNMSKYDLMLSECFDRGSLREHIEYISSIKNELLDMANEKWLLDYSDIFDENKDPVYFDMFHLLSAGNKIIAERVWSDILG